MQPPKIVNSAKEKRRAYVMKARKWLHDCEACDNCSILKGRDAETLYADYIGCNGAIWKFSDFLIVDPK